MSKPENPKVKKNLLSRILSIVPVKVSCSKSLYILYHISSELACMGPPGQPGAASSVDQSEAYKLDVHHGPVSDNGPHSFA